MRNDELMHYGIKGMKWGVRKKRDNKSVNKRKTKKQYIRQEIDQTVTDKKNSGRKWKTSAGYDISLEPNVPPKMAQFLARYSSSIRKNIKNSSSFTISSNGKKIGDLQLEDNPKDNSVNVVWIGIDKSERGNGYAQSVMNNIVDSARNNGKSKVTLEVPGTSPDARHIYEKVGFKPTGEVLGDEDDVWSGLTVMELDLKERRRMKHSEVGSTNNELYHYGIKGMKWGVRKKKNNVKPHDDYVKAHSKKSVKEMSDNELRSRLNRLQMEQNYSKLQPKKVSRGKKAFDKLNKTLTSVAAITGTGLTLYNNADRIRKILEENGVTSSGGAKKVKRKVVKKAAKRAAKEVSRMAIDYNPYK